MEPRKLHNAMRQSAVAMAAITLGALCSACSSSGPEPSSSASPSPSASAVVSTELPLDDQLFSALRNGDAALTKAVLEAGADVNAPLPGNSTAIGIAVTRKAPDLVAAVLEAQPDLTALDSRGLAVMNAACQQGVTGEVAELLIEAGAELDVVSPDSFNSVAIHDCAYSGSQDAIDVMLEHGVDVNLRQVDNGATALIVAAWQGHGDLVAHLLEVGADPSITTSNGSTAHKWAQVGGHQDVVALLEAAGAY